MEKKKKPFVIGLITARGGSIRLPRKNIKQFCGHPLVAWSIIQARCAKGIDLVVLTTDDLEIAEIGRRYGAKVIIRPVMDNDISAGVPFRMAVKELEDEGIIIDEIVYLLPTSPLKKIDDLDNLISYFHLIRNYNPIEQLDTFCPDRETFIFKNIEEMVNEYGKPYHVSRVISDKSWKYSKMGGGWNIGTKNYLIRQWNLNSDKDSEIDKNLDTIMFDGAAQVNGYSIEPWQCFETDYDSYFRVCESLMEEFVLKGKGMSAYTDYAREFRRIVTWEEENKDINLSNYAGNCKQFDGNDIQKAQLEKLGLTFRKNDGTN